MKAIVFDSPGGPEVLKVKEVKKPEPSRNDVSNLSCTFQPKGREQ